MAISGDAIWAAWDAASPPYADLALASGTQPARCNPRHRDFIDLIVQDLRAATHLASFEETTCRAAPLSDHCAVSARLR